ncbi:MAG TPA: serine hydrolase [Gemmatimonadaceae bacterium]|nr:serine hydrolase [Gemmatimonadaceae bacterium]
MQQIYRFLTAFGLSFLLAAASGSAALAQSAAPPAAPPAAVTPASPAPLDPAALAGKIDEYMQAQARVNGFTGSILLAREGQPLVSKGYGFANIEWQIPNTPQTKFRIGSVTKQFTSMSVMQLREQGKLKLEDFVCVYVSPCPDAWKPVTIHHLLTHTSGIPTFTGLPEWRKVNMVPKTVDEMIDFFRELPLQWVPGEKYAYNNSGYFLLGAVIEKAAGKKYEQVLREQIFTPLDMVDSGYDWSATIIPRRASGYSGRPPAVSNAAALDMQQPYSAGSLYSTTGDLLKWDQALYTDRLLPAAARQTMWTPFRDNYAYGWTIVPPATATFGHRRVEHGGGINGFSAMIVRLPETNVTSIVLANTDALPGAGAAAVARDLLAIYYGQSYTLPAPRIVAKVDPAIYDQYVGKYELSPTSIMTVTREGNSLMAQPTGQPKIEVFPESETKFFPQVRIEATITFEKDASGKVVALMLTHGGRNQRAKKIE